MSETLALYRKYRPSDFSEVRDQEHIVTVLEGAIKKNAIPHALLFCGSRGTGKTTLARIFARAIGVSDNDLYEIDAASNRGIDDIRELKEAVHTLPYQSERKVYIIDEVHMLTKEAFNALLKTLEEPPAHVVFILATTEEDKLLDTIKSRCQVFRFRSPSRTVLKETVTDVAKKEKCKLDPEAADLIAIAADGSFRDALGILQKVMMASSDETLKADEVATIIGAPRGHLLVEVVEALSEKNVERALETVAKATASSTDMRLFVRLLLERARAVILLRNLPARRVDILANYSEEESAFLEKLATDPKSPVNSHMLLRLLDTAELTTRSQIPSLPLEVAIVDLCQK
ncbi:DNA polymerase III subunit gamma/tau [Candidatus Nomurabacteria bacterium]|nr:DNA polymerase III subunit gamma/tau [Candidatus Nomurabacteria bacterium]MCB9819215.1 DNA polymerase III subunit gamma/tau [Candidatus Nomurabacteria bacterium]